MSAALPYDEVALVELISDANKHRNGGANETVIRQTLIDGLARVFASVTRPWWVERHIRGAEQHLVFRDGDQRSGYADSVVGLTAIEYETDLRNDARFSSGEHQVRQYCAGVLNTRADPKKIRGVLSDGVEWRAYKLADVAEKTTGDYHVEDIELRQLGPSLICDQEDAATAIKLMSFWEEHLGREGTRPLTASSVADYFDLDSGFGRKHLSSFGDAVHGAFDGDPNSRDLIEHVWSRFVAYLSADNPTFDVDAYVQEFYLVTLARLMCANVIEQRAMRSDDSELDEILNGEFFEAKGLHRLVEDDYFGWLARRTNISTIRPLARSLQDDLAAYDFSQPPADDLFGGLLAAMATRTQRILLGQEMTPKNLADEMAEALFDALEPQEPPRFVDMCCGSGTMLVAVAQKARERITTTDLEPGSREYLDYLAEACTGFDIDPLAVMLAKVNWVQTNRSALEPLDGSRVVSLPVFHADSLFAVSPVFGDTTVDEEDDNPDYRLRLFDSEIDLPRFLIDPDRRVFFDELLDRSQSLSRQLASGSRRSPDTEETTQIIDDSATASQAKFTDTEVEATGKFLKGLIARLAQLERDGRNGIWVFAIRNAYWPQLVAGQFNGIISNPPWLAMSKIGNNPLGPALSDLADQYGLKPQGPSAPHLEMSTVFLAHSVVHFLGDGGHIACVLPDTIRNGAQHDPFRLLVSGLGGQSGLELRMEEMWTVRHGTFKNRAVVIIGTKATPRPLATIPGRVVPGPGQDAPHYVHSGARSVWSHSHHSMGSVAPYPAGFWSQGADIMPRRLVFFDVAPAAAQRMTISTIRRASPNSFLVNDAKKHKSFEITKRTISQRFVHRVYLSKHLAPFALAPPSRAVLPALFQGTRWYPALETKISMSPQAEAHFNRVINESSFDSLDNWWDSGIDMRGKLSQQSHSTGSWVVVYGAGGAIPAASYFPTNSSEPVIIDQTLYWAKCNSKEEALYIVGLLNSLAIREQIDGYAPVGEFGERHLHLLPARAMPKYDRLNSVHAAVVDNTRALVAELHSEAAANPQIASCFTTTIGMPARRRKLRAAIQRLHTAESYENACSAVF